MQQVGSKGVPRHDREQQLLRSAIDEFGRSGYAGASLVRIASGAGVSKAMVYHLFTSKEGLALAAVEHIGPALVAAVAEAESRRAATPTRRALDTLTAIFSALGEDRHAWAVIYDPTLPTGTAAAASAARYRRELGSLGTTGSGAVLVAAGDDDVLDHELLDRLWQTTVATTMRWWQDHDELSAADMAQRCARLLTAIGAP